jgi:hypothetical protein
MTSVEGAAAAVVAAGAVVVWAGVVVCVDVHPANRIPPKRRSKMSRIKESLKEPLIDFNPLQQSNVFCYRYYLSFKPVKWKKLTNW